MSVAFQAFASLGPDDEEPIGKPQPSIEAAEQEAQDAGVAYWSVYRVSGDGIPRGSYVSMSW